MSDTVNTAIGLRFEEKKSLEFLVAWLMVYVFHSYWKCGWVPFIIGGFCLSGTGTAGVGYG